MLKIKNLKTFIPEHIIDELRSRADIVEIIGESVLIKKRGQNYIGLCPFHTEKTPSFTVSPEKQIYHCFGCGAGGNAFKYLMETQDLSFVQAVEKLANRFGVVLPKASAKTRSGLQGERETLIQINQEAMNFFHHRLDNTNESKEALDYIKKRNFKSETITKFQIGWAPREWSGLINHFGKQKKCVLNRWIHLKKQ